MATKIITDKIDRVTPGDYIEFDDNTNLDISGINSYLVLPQGTNDERVGVVDGPSVLRWNTDSKSMELFNGSNWTTYSFQQDIDAIINSGTILFLDASDLSNFNGLIWSNLYKNFSLNGELKNNISRSTEDFGSLIFNSVDTYVDVPGFGQNATTAEAYFTNGEGWTFSFWFKADPSLNFGTSPPNKILIGINAADASNIFRIGVVPTGGGIFYSQNNGGSVQDYTINSGTNYNNDTWYNLVVTRPYGSTTQTARFYINGSQIGTQTSDSIDWSQISSTYIGAEVDDVNTFAPSDTFGGNISVIHILDREVTSSEVLNNFNALKDRYGI